jgi:hypothetical protein
MAYYNSRFAPLISLNAYKEQQAGKIFKGKINTYNDKIGKRLSNQRKGAMKMMRTEI